MPDQLSDTPTPAKIFWIFTRIGLTSFGGGLSGWLWREFVKDRKWLSEEEFLNGLSLSQALPGVNVTNMALWIGYRLGGGGGAAAGLAGIVLPAAVLIIVIATLFASVAKFELTHLALAGAAAAAIGLSASMGIMAARRVPRTVLPLLTMAATFVAIVVLHLPLVYVVLVAGSLSVLLTHLTLDKA